MFPFQDLRRYHREMTTEYLQ